VLSERSEHIKVWFLLTVLISFLLLSVVARDSLIFIFSLFFITVPLVSLLLSEDDKRFVLMTVTLAFLVRVLIAYVLHVNSWHRGFEGFISGDDRLYSLKALKMALVWQHLPYNSISDSGGLTYGINSFTRALVIIYRFFEANYFNSKMLNCYLGAVTPVFIFFIGKRLFSPAVGKGAMAITAFYPSLVRWSVCNLKDTLIIFCLASFFFLLFTTKKDMAGLLKFIAMLVVLSLLKSLQSICMYAIAGASAVWGLRKVSTMLKSKMVRVVLILFLIVYAFVWYDLLKPHVYDGLVFLATYQSGMCTADSAGYSLYSHDFIKQLQRFELDIPTLSFAYIKGMIYFIFSPFPWKINSLNQLMAYPEVVIWYFLVFFAMIGVCSGFKRFPQETLFVLSFVVIGISLLALGEGNIGAAFRHRGYFAPLIFIYAAAGMTHIFKRGST